MKFVALLLLVLLSACSSLSSKNRVPASGDDDRCESSKQNFTSAFADAVPELRQLSLQGYVPALDMSEANRVADQLQQPGHLRCAPEDANLFDDGPHADTSLRSSDNTVVFIPGFPALTSSLRTRHIEADVHNIEIAVAAHLILVGMRIEHRKDSVISAVLNGHQVLSH